MKTAASRQCKIIPMIAFLLLVPGISRALVENWETVQANPQHTGYMPVETFRSAPQVEWEVDAEGSLFGSPIIRADGSVIVSAGTENKIVAIDPKGEVLWSYPAAGAIYGSPALLDDGNIAFGDSMGFIYTLDSDGNEVSSSQNSTAQIEKRILCDTTGRPGGGLGTGDWRGQLLFNKNESTVEHALPPGSMSQKTYPATPVTFSKDGTKAYYAFREGTGGTFRVRCINPDTGGTNWTFTQTIPSPNKATLNMSAVCLDEDNYRAYAIGSNNGKSATAGSYLYAINTTNGLGISGFPVCIDAGSYCTPALSEDGSAVYVTTLTGLVKKYNTSTGGLLWTYDSGAQMIRGSAVVDGSGRVFFGDMNGAVHCLNGATGELVWRYEGDGSVIASSPAIASDGSVVMGTTNGKVFKLDQPVIPYLEGQTPTLDGVLDAGEWANAWHVSVRADKDPGINPGWDYKDGGYPPETLTIDDCSYEMYVFHNGTDLYVALDVNDEVVRFDESPTPPASWTAAEYIKNVWWDDCTEVFIDADCDDVNEGADTVLPTPIYWREGIHLHFGVLGHIMTKADNLMGLGETYHTAWWGGTALRPGGYIHEYRLKLSEFDKEDGPGFTPLAPGDVIGFNTVANDDDLYSGVGDRREDMLVWWGSETDTFRVPELWPRVLLAPTPFEEPDGFTLTYIAGPGGTVQGTNPQTVAQGEDGTAVTALPSAGYHFVNWTLGGVEYATTPELTVLNVTSSMTFTANFAHDTGALSVTIEPAAAVAAGAKWRRQGTSTWFDSGATETGIPTGDYVVEFMAITGWTTPGTQNVTIAKDATTSGSVGTYVEITAAEAWEQYK